MSDMPAIAARFAVVADVCPGLLPRLLEPFAKRSLTPDALHAEREGDAMRIDISLEAMPAGMVHLINGNLGQIVGVRSVEVTAAGFAMPLAA